MQKPTILIEPSKGWVSLDLRELWQYRELIGFLAWRNIMALYKQAFFGIAWALVKPISQALIYTLVFGKVANLSSSGQPYILFTFCGIVAWGFFSTSLSSSTNSIVGNANLITKVYFPRLAIPLSSLGTGCVDFVISFAIFLVIMLCYGVLPGLEIFLFPVFLFLGLALTLGSWAVLLGHFSQISRPGPCPALHGSALVLGHPRGLRHRKYSSKIEVDLFPKPHDLDHPGFPLVPFGRRRHGLAKTFHYRPFLFHRSFCRLVLFQTYGG